jgi:hypothetical protein
LIIFEGDVNMATKPTALLLHSKTALLRAVAVMTAATLLAGCETGSGLLNGTNQPPVAVTEPANANKLTTVAIAPVLGVPEATSQQLVTELSNSLDKSRFTVVTSASTPADYTLRGYATAAREKSSSKLSYFFDVTDKSGKKVNRIAGEEALAAAPAGKDVWQGMTPQISKSVATKTAQNLTAFIPVGAPAAGALAAQPAVADAGSAAATKVAASGAEASAAKAGPATGSITKPATTAALVPNVTGAPGDGGQSLTAAIQKELTKNGIALASGAGSPAGSNYRVEGRVALGAPNAGKQPIQIDWDVKDPQGKKLGTVSQKNEIDQGSLDGAWGKTADAAAAAAAQGIVKLLPANKATP